MSNKSAFYFILFMLQKCSSHWYLEISFRATMAVGMIPPRLLANNSYLERLAHPLASILKHSNYPLYYTVLN